MTDHPPLNGHTVRPFPGSSAGVRRRAWTTCLASLVAYAEALARREATDPQRWAYEDAVPTLAATPMPVAGYAAEQLGAAIVTLARGFLKAGTAPVQAALARALMAAVGEAAHLIAQQAEAETPAARKPYAED